MEKYDFSNRLSSNTYPGRGIAIGMAPSGKKAIIVYFIMGRSANSRNRIFSPIDGGIETKAADPSKMQAPSLVIYNPVLTLGKTTIVTNGDQTNTIYDFLRDGKTFEDALRTRTYEPDGPNWTPRISGMVDMQTGAYKLSILKSADGNENAVRRYFFDYSQPLAGEGHFIHTYKGDGNPIPSFDGEPERVSVAEDPRAFAAAIWGALNEDNKVSLFVRAIDLETRKYEDVIINKYDPV